MAGRREEAVTFRTKLLLISSLTVTGAVALVTGAASIATRRALERIDSQRRLALLKQFEHEMRVQGEEVVTSVQRIVASEAVLRVAAEAGRPEPDFASFYNSAPAIAQTAGLDFVDVTRRDLTI